MRVKDFLELCDLSEDNAILLYDSNDDILDYITDNSNAKGYGNHLITLIDTSDNGTIELSLLTEITLITNGIEWYDESSNRWIFDKRYGKDYQ